MCATNNHLPSISCRVRHSAWCTLVNTYANILGRGDWTLNSSQQADQMWAGMTPSSLRLTDIYAKEWHQGGHSETVPNIGDRNLPP